MASRKALSLYPLLLLPLLVHIVVASPKVDQVTSVDNSWIRFFCLILKVIMILSGLQNERPRGIQRRNCESDSGAEWKHWQKDQGGEEPFFNFFFNIFNPLKLNKKMVLFFLLLQGVIILLGGVPAHQLHRHS